MKKENKKIKMKEVVNQYFELGELVKEKKVFAGEVSLAIAKNFKTLRENVEARDEAAKSLIEKYAKHDEAGKPELKGQKYIFETDEDEKAFNDAFLELNETETEIEVHTISYELLKENEKYSNPTAADLVTLDFMMTY
jgi:hypothetical protein